MAEKITIAELDIDTDALLKAATQTKEALNAVKEEQKALKKSGEESSAQFVKNETSIKKLNKTYQTQQKTLTALTDENNKLVKSQQALDDALNETINTENQATKSNQKLLAIRKDINKNTAEGRKQIERINAKIDQNNELLAGNASEQGKVKIGIGDYEGALRRVFPNIGAFTDSIRSNIEGLKSQKTAMQASAAGTGGLTRAMKLLRVAIIATGIGALLVALVSLRAAFTSSEEGQNKWNKILTVTGAIIGNLTDLLADFGEWLIDVFENPRESLNSFAKLLKDNIVNRFEGLVELIPALAESVKLLFQGEFAEAGKTATDALGKVALGAEDVTEKIVEATQATKGFIDEQVREANAAARVADMRAEADRIDRDLLIERSKIEAQIAELRLKSREEDRFTAAERKKFLEESIELQEELLDQEVRSATLKKEAQVLENTFSRSNKENLDKEAQAIADLNNVQTQRLNFQRQIQRELIRVSRQQGKEEEDRVKRQEEANKKDLERASLFENQKRELQNQIDLENAETEEEKAILKAEQDFEKQALELERLQLEEEQKTELLSLLALQRSEVLADIQSNIDAKKIKAIQDTNKKELAADKAGADARASVAQELNSILTGLLGDSLGAKIASVAIEAATQIGLLNIETSAAQAKNLAQATAALPPPLNAPLITAAGAQNVALGVKSKSAQAKILASAALKTFGGLFAAYEGGLVPTGTGGAITHKGNIPAQRGGDNILATVKTGEVILNEEQQARAGGAAFFNSIGVPGFQNGGLTGVTTPAQVNQVQQMNLEELSTILAEKINAVKIVAIESDITDAQVKQAEIVSGADV